MRSALLALILGLIQLSSAAPRNWAKNPAIVELDTPEDIYAIGDAHSDYTRVRKALHGAGVTDESGHWIARKSVLISTGDMIDKGPRALDVLRFYKALRQDARSQGGNVILLAGNHEAEFLANPAAPKGHEFAKQLKAEHIDPASVGACEGEIGELLCSLAFGARINEWFFSHAGNPGGRTLRAKPSVSPTSSKATNPLKSSSSTAPSAIPAKCSSASDSCFSSTPA
jgi:hypothetical protein